MLSHSSRIAALLLVTSAALWFVVGAQEPPLPVAPGPVGVDVRSAPDAPEVPKGVDVQARGPVHEAFAAPTVEPKEMPAIAKKPPAPLDEMPPEEKPEGDMVWINGYWAFDEERSDFLWVSGCWRTRPPGKEWITGYWREQGEQWQWVGGFWAGAAAAPAGGVAPAKASEVTYYPQPPAPPAVAPPGDPPVEDSFYIPGHWVWRLDHYAWQPGYWGRIQPGYVWVQSHYRWTPHGFVFVAGYWDLALTRRGVLYAPVTVDYVVVGPRFVYTPRYAVCDAIVLDALFIRPSHCHYYFGDYYGPRYSRWGFETCVVYSRRSYDPVFVYERWGHRSDPRWLEVQVTIAADRHAGRAPLPPRTLVEMRTRTDYKVAMIAPTRVVMASRGQKTVMLDATARGHVLVATREAHATALKERHFTETGAGAAALTKPHVASFSTPASTLSKTAATGTGALGKTGDKLGGTSLGKHSGTGTGTGSHPTIGSRPPLKGPLLTPKKDSSKKDDRKKDH